MAMSNCKECGKAVSTLAKTCPSCGVPKPAKVLKKKTSTKKIIKKAENHKVEDWRDDPRFSGKRKESSKKTEARNQWDELGWLDQDNHGSFEEYYKTIKVDKSIKSKTKEVLKKEESTQDSDWRKALGINYEDEEDTKSAVQPAIKTQKKEKSTQDSDWRKALGINYEDEEDTKSAVRSKKKTQKKEKSTQDSDWRKALGINYEDEEDTKSAIKIQKKEDGGGYGFIIIIGLIVIGAGIYFNYSDSSSSKKTTSSSSSTCKNDLKWSWYINDKKTAAVFNFKNNGLKSIKITSRTIYDLDGDVIQSNTANNVYLAPGQERGLFLFSDSIRYAEKGSYGCIYDKPYGKSKKTKQKKSGFKWWYLLVAAIAFHVIRAIMAEISSKDKPSNVKQEEIIEVKSSATSSDDNFIEDVFEGKKPLAETFWLYYVLANGLISFGAGYLADSNDNNIYLIAALVSNIWAGIGTWNSSTNYQVEKIKSGQPYGWAYGAKIMIVLNFITIVGQAILLFSL